MTHPVETTDPIPVLVYHAVEQRLTPDITTVSPTRLHRQLRSWKQQRVTLINLEQYIRQQGSQQPDERLLLLTFDDGYASLLSEVIPLLKEFHFPAVVFPVVGYAGGENDWDPARFGCRRRHLDLSQLAELSENDIAIGNHSLLHRDSSRLTITQLAKEWLTAHQRLSDCGLAPVAAAWPFGRTSSAACATLEEQGYQVAFSLAAGTGWPWQVPRLTCYRFSRSPLVYEKLLLDYSGKRLLQRFPAECNRLSVLFQRTRANNA
ncbi:polysaccharide deacetylase family protein [bacterium]|nr:polysaccharide deacetylase family protein [bacterium]